MTSEDSEAERPSTLPESALIELKGFESDDAANKFSSVFYAYLSVIGRHINLERLVAVTVAYDYPTD